jgi:phage-related protein
MRLRYYTTARGDRPVAAYIEGRSRADQAVIAVALTEIAERGREARGVTFRQLAGKLWELRIGPHRIFYVLWHPAEMVLLHAYRKQTQKAPARHVEIAQRRMREVLGCRQDAKQ